MANVVALGIVVSLSEVVSRQAITNAVLTSVPQGTEGLNRRALELGFHIGEQLR